MKIIISENRGAVVITVALILGVLVSMTALTVDIGYGLVTRTQLHAIADGSALAGTRQLGLVYEGLTSAEQQNYTLSSEGQQAITTMVTQVGQANKAGGKAITINDGDIQVGRWDFEAQTFTAGLNSPNAVRVTARRDRAANGPIVTFFAGIMGINTINVSATATAALGALSSTIEGDLPVPIGISEYWFSQGEYCGEDIKFSPTGDMAGCAGWHTYEDGPANARRLGGILDGLADQSYESPATELGYSSFEFIGGDVASRFSNFQELFETRKEDYSPYDTWKTSVVVYGWDDCSNPNKDIPITGYAKVEIYEVLGPPEKTIKATVLCNEYETGRSSGTNFGLMGTIPGLVE
ncbi:MAG: hypothetical protein IH978_08150 [Nitrospinae bacterium]|nr:hypothetical protein [Nitrospinota bacterium]